MDVGPPAAENPAIPQVIECDDSGLNAHRMCKANSCCDGVNVDEGFCKQTLDYYENNMNLERKSAMDSICVSYTLDREFKFGNVVANFLLKSLSPFSVVLLLSI